MISVMMVISNVFIFSIDLVRLLRREKYEFYSNDHSESEIKTLPLR